VLDGTRLRQLRPSGGLSQKQWLNRAAISLAPWPDWNAQSQAPCRSDIGPAAAALDQQPSTIRPPAPAVAPSRPITVPWDDRPAVSNTPGFRCCQRLSNPMSALADTDDRNLHGCVSPPRPGTGPQQ